MMAEAVGFEPTCPCGQLHFECSSLQPLRYASMYKYSLSGTNHMISSQSRYDHFDTAPYLSQHQHLRKRGELMGRTSKNIKLRIPEKPRKIKGFRTGSYRVATTISSQSRYDHFDIAPCLFPPAILVISKALKNPLERKAGEKAKKYSI